MEDAFTAVILANPDSENDVRFRRLNSMKQESWDFYLRVFSDGSLTVRAVTVCSTINLSDLDTEPRIEHRPATSYATQSVQFIAIPPWSIVRASK